MRRGKEVSPGGFPWYWEIEPGQWKALAAAWGGWMLDSMDFVMYLMAIPSLQSEFHFSTGTAGLLTTVALLTSAVGGIAFGAWADRVGRTKTLSITILVYSFCSLGSATAQSIGQLMVWRALLGFGMGGEWSAGAVLVSETWPAAHRGKAVGIMQSGWALGYILAACLAALLLPLFGWRWLFAAGVLPALLVVWIRRTVREPSIWSAPQERRSPFRNLRSLFAPEIRPVTVKAVAMSGSVMFAYWGLFTWMPSFLSMPVEDGGAGLGLVKSTAWIIPMQLGAFLGYLTFGFFSDRFGRRPVFICFLLVAAALVPVYGTQASHPAILWLVGPLVGFFGHGYFSVFGAQLAELFPTGIRATAQGFAYNAGRAFSAAAPLAVGIVAGKRGLGTAITLTSAFFVMGAAVSMLLPETRGKELEPDAPDIASS